MLKVFFPYDISVTLMYTDFFSHVNRKNPPSKVSYFSFYWAVSGLPRIARSVQSSYELFGTLFMYISGLNMHMGFDRKQKECKFRKQFTPYQEENF